MRPDRCRACGEQFIDHLGIEGTCSRLGSAKTTLRVLYTWATCEGGCGLDPENVAQLVRRTLTKIGCPPAE